MRGLAEAECQGGCWGGGGAARVREKWCVNDDATTMRPAVLVN